MLYYSRMRRFEKVKIKLYNGLENDRNLRVFMKNKYLDMKQYTLFLFLILICDAAGNSAPMRKPTIYEKSLIYRDETSPACSGIDIHVVLPSRVGNCLGPLPFPPTHSRENSD